MVANKFPTSQRANRIAPSITFTMNARARELAKDHPMIFLGLGEPDFPTPDPIKEAAIAAIHNNQTHYTAVDGTAELKAAIIAKLKRDHDLDYAPSSILASTGAKQAIANAIAALINEGDEVITPSPCWASYPDMIKLSAGVPVALPTSDQTHFKITPEQLEAAITPKTKLLMLNSPSNPTGMIYSRQELEALGAVLRQHPHVYILSDDIYEHIIWSEHAFCNIVMACPDLKERTVLINGVSKAYAMTGWRLGFAAGPLEWIKAMKKIQSQVTSSPSSITQAAAASAFNAPLDMLQPMVRAFKERANFVIKELNTMDGIHALMPDGAFYAFFDTSAWQQRLGLEDDMALAHYLIDKIHIAAVPGSAFGSPNHLRLSIATSMENLQEAMERLRKI